MNNYRVKMSANDGSGEDKTDNKCMVPEKVTGTISSEVTTVPEKSKVVYNNAYNKFMEWKRKEGDKPFSQQLLFDYFSYLHDVQQRKPSSLWAVYSMLKTTIKKNNSVDIGTYEKLSAYLKEQSVGYETKKAKSLTSRNINTFLNDAPDQEYLAVKVSLIFAMIGGCRREELCNLAINDIKDNGHFALVTIRNPETNAERSFAIVDEFYKIYKKYALLRPNNTRTDRFFMQYRDGRCRHQGIGINRFGSMPKLIASWLKLPDPEDYTGHTFRVSANTIIGDSYTDIMSLRSNPALRTTSDEFSSQEALTRKIKLAQRIMETIFIKPSTSNEALSSNILKASTSLSPASLSIPSASAISTSSPNFETVYLPFKGECDDGNMAMVERNIASLGGKDISGSSVEVGNTINTLRNSLVSTVKEINSPARPPQLGKIPPVTISAPLQLQESRETSHTKRIQPPQNTVPQTSSGVRLKWNSHHSNMQNSFPSLLDSEEFVDVTLACEGKSIKCHKIILSSCSDYLAQLLRENPCLHPIILMKDLEFWQVEALIHFMYKGEVQVPHERLAHLLNAATALKIKGLTGFALTKLQKNSALSAQPKLQSSEPTVPQQSSVIKSAVPENSSVAVEPKAPINSKSSPQLNEKRGTKRLLETGETRSFVKIRLQRKKSPPKLRAESPEIKYEPIDLPPSPIDNITDINYDCSMRKQIDLMKMHEDDDPGGVETFNSDTCPVKLEAHNPDDIDDREKQMEFISTEYLDDELDILDKMDRQSSSNDPVDTRRGMKFVSDDILNFEQDMTDKTLNESRSNIVDITDSNHLRVQCVRSDDFNEEEEDET